MKKVVGKTESRRVAHTLFLYARNITRVKFGVQVHSTSVCVICTKHILCNFANFCFETFCLFQQINRVNQNSSRINKGKSNNQKQKIWRNNVNVKVPISPYAVSCFAPCLCNKF